MKTLFQKFILLTLFVVFIASMACAQGASTLKDANYANDSTYNYTAPDKIGAYRSIALQISAPDSFSGKTYVETRVKGTSTWTVKDSLTITNATTSATNSEWVLRDATTEKIPGIYIDVRFRTVCASSGNTTTPTQKMTATIRFVK
jgi:hypothetical protein